jgi:hypothetical protein
MRLRTALFSLVPGAAHVDLGRPGSGVGLFFLFALFVNAALLAPFLSSDRRLRAACGAAAAAVWILAFFDAMRRSGRTSPKGDS